MLNPSTANIKYAVEIFYKNRATLVAGFQDFDSTMDFTKFTKALKLNEDGEPSSLDIFDKGRPNARKMLIMVYSSLALANEKKMEEWRARFVKDNVMVVVVAFGTKANREKLKPLTPSGVVITIDQTEDPKDKGKRIAEEIAKGKPNVYNL